MENSSVASVLFFLIGNYFFTFLIIGFVAAGISLLNKPKPLRINMVAEAFFSYYLLFPIGISNVVNFVFHVFFGEMAAKFIGWQGQPVSGRSRICESRRWHCRHHSVQSQLAISIRDIDSPFRFRVGSSCRTHLPDDRGA